MKEYDITKIKVDKVYRKDGEFVAENGNRIEYSNYYIDFQVEGYELVFTAKVDKAVAKYLEKAYAEN